MCGAMNFGVADYSERAGHERAAEIAITLFAQIAEPSCFLHRALLRHEAELRPRNPDLIGRILD